MPAPVWDGACHPVDQARRKQSQRHGGGRQREAVEGAEIAVPGPSFDLLALEEALGELEKVDEPKARLVKLRYFAGLTSPQAAEALGISLTTADRYWAYARAWLPARRK